VRIGITLLQLLGGGAVGGREPGEALVEVVADGLTGGVEERSRRFLEPPELGATSLDKLVFSPRAPTCCRAQNFVLSSPQEVPSTGERAF
jgi:hypothetical protein